MLLFLPGCFLLRAFFGKSNNFLPIERMVLSFALSTVILDFLIIIIGTIGLAINAVNIIAAVAIFLATCLIIYKTRKPKNQKVSENPKLTKKQLALILLIFFLSIFIKAAYLKDTIAPTATDMGHHMYWASLTRDTGELPVYQERDIVEENGNYALSQPEPIADFIIGEHLIFAAFSLVSGLDFFGPLPVLILLLFNVFSLLAVLILSLRAFKDKRIALLALLFIGPLWAISTSQAKYISGGVIGNTIGNLLIPVTLYFILRAWKERSSLFMAFGVFSALGLAYTHHLSTFVFIFIIAFSAIIFTFSNLKNLGYFFRRWLKLILSPAVLSVIFLGIIFVFLVYTPNYIATSAIETAVGAPSKETREGLTFTEIKSLTGEARYIFALLGIILIFALRKTKNIGSAIISGWGLAILAMITLPHLLKVNIPSGRIANYINYPFAIIAAFFLVWLFDFVKSKKNLRPEFGYGLFFLVMIFALSGGFFDNSQSLKSDGEINNYNQTWEVFDGSRYLAQTINGNDVVIKDHNFLMSDAWIKLFFVRDYNFPLSRSFFHRYEDPTKPREMCTLWMISEPSTQRAQTCFEGTGTNFIMINKDVDSAQFEKKSNFNLVFSGEKLNIYQKIK